MTEENQVPISGLEQTLLEMGDLSIGTSEFNDADANQRAGIINHAAHVMASGGDYATFIDAFKELEVSDAAYVTKAKNAINTRARNIEDQYNANKGAIISDVVGKLNAILASAKAEVKEKGGEFGEADAYQVIASILKPLIYVPMPSQGYADALKRRDAAEKLQMTLITQARGDPEEARELRRRTKVAEDGYVKAGENGYSIDGEKIAELMDGPQTGAVAYTLTRPRNYAQAA